MTPASANRSLMRFHYALLGLSVTLIVLAAVYNLSTVRQIRQSVASVTDVLDVQAQISALRAQNQDVETYGLRYLLSQRDDFLRSFVQAGFTLDDQLEILAEMVAHNPQQLDYLERMGEDIALRNELLRREIALSQEGGLQEVVRMVRTGEGAALLNRIRSWIQKMDYESQQVLRQRQQQLESVIVQSTATVLLVDALALAAGVIAFVAIRRSGRALEERRIAEMHALQAQRASNEKSAFLASMSHEIRTPMNAVFGYTELLAKTRIEPQAREYIKAIQTSGQVLLALINDILDLSRIEAGKLSLRPEACDIRDLVDSSAAVFAEAATRKQIGLRAEVAPAVPKAVLVDGHRLRQVLLNLLSNAIKYTEQGEVRVRVSARTAQSGFCQLCIEVADTGVGIAASKRAQLFEPFYRAGEGEPDQPAGAGLGLAIVKRLVQLMQGDIEVDSQPGRGSQFRVLIPDLPICQPPGSRESGAQDVDFAQLQPSRILIVDDVSWNRDLFAAFLADAGHRLEFASNGAEALLRAQQFKPQLVLMDLRMPVMDGHEASRQLRAAMPTVKIIAVSASTLLGDEGRSSGEFDGFLHKPVSRENLFHALLELFGRRAAPEHEPGPAPTARKTASVVDQSQRAEALQRLQQIVRQRLPAVAAALRTREVRALAAELKALGEQGGIEAIVYYADRLNAALERFDVSVMETLLRQLPEYVQQATAAEATE